MVGQHRGQSSLDGGFTIDVRVGDSGGQTNGGALQLADRGAGLDQLPVDDERGFRALVQPILDDRELSLRRDEVQSRAFDRAIDARLNLDQCETLGGETALQV